MSLKHYLLTLILIVVIGAVVDGVNILQASQSFPQVVFSHSRLSTMSHVGSFKRKLYQQIQRNNVQTAGIYDLLCKDERGQSLHKEPEEGQAEEEDLSRVRKRMLREY